MEMQWDHKIFNSTNDNFEDIALEVFKFQYENNDLYKAYVDAIHRTPERVRKIEEIPFLPIRFFKTHRVTTGLIQPATVFESSGTTGMEKSQHHVQDPGLYEKSFIKTFELFYGDLQEYCILGLLPSYLERKNSSLVYMVNEWIKRSGHPSSGFYLHEWEDLARVLQELESRSQKTLLIGVSFALLDFAETFSFPLQNTTLMETGGMKGRRVEMVREELHEKLKRAFQLDQIHSEYGMTELLSQAYSYKDGIFRSPPWMKILIRDDDDPQEVKANPRSKIRGAINIIDLVNVHSCSFIATDDLGRLHPDSSFEVMGRMDNSDIRGCSLMAG
jgi:phenylacetate-coenzyme A ligase PaaK-like adenylate-forming protein